MVDSLYLLPIWNIKNPPAPKPPTLNPPPSGPTPTTMNTEPEEIEDDFTDECKHCLSEMEWQECWNCGGEGGRDYDNHLQFEDPLWYSPGDFETCDVCEGKGGYYMCTNDSCSKNDTVPQAG